MASDLYVLKVYMILHEGSVMHFCYNSFTNVMKALTRKTLAIFWRHARKYHWQLAAIAFGVLGYTALHTYVPILYRDLLNVLAGGVSDRSGLARAAIHIIVLILVFNVAKNLVWRVVLFTESHFTHKVMYDLMNTCYGYLQQHSYGFFTSRFVGSLVTKVKRFERSFQTISHQAMFILGRSLLDTGMIMAVMLWQYPSIGLIVLGWSVFFIVVSTIFSLYKLKYDIKKADSDTQVTAQLADSITNNINIKLFTNLFKERKMFEGVTHKQFALRKKTQNMEVAWFMIQSFLSIGLEFLVIYMAIQLWREGVFGVGDIALLQTYLLRIFDKIWEVGQNITKIYEALADANEMTEMLVAPHEVRDAPAAKPLKVRQGHIEFRDVSFGYYRETPVLRDFSLDISPGERLALIGPSGGGKSTIVKTLFRFHDIQSGGIFIDGRNIAAVTQDSLRANMSLVPQDPILFHRSLMDNIRYARPGASDKEVIRAAKLAHADEFISSFREGYKTLVGERGIKLSGGERQRVAIARAILKDAPILVLDEATSSLDSESEMYIQDALKKLMEGRTTIVVAHRLSTIMQMDRIVVIDDGRVVEQGKHAELLRVKQGMYQKLWDIQAGGFGPASPPRAA